MTPQQVKSENDFIESMKPSSLLAPGEAETFVAILHKLDRIRLAEVAGYAWGLATIPRHTVITPDAVQWKESKP